MVRFETVMLPQIKPLPCWARVYVGTINFILNIPRPVGPVSFVTTLMCSMKNKRTLNHPLSNSCKFPARSTREGRTSPASR